MPIYEYKCAKCGTCFEALVLSADEAVACEKCGSSLVDKQLSGFSCVSGGGGGGLPSMGGGCGGGGFS